jgi:hypothetical protein
LTLFMPKKSAVIKYTLQVKTKNKITVSKYPVTVE